jgi:hypothetical protein
VYYTDYIPETSSDWMDETELREWAYEFFDGAEEPEHMAAWDVEEIREMHREHFAESEDAMNGSEAIWHAHEDEWQPHRRAGAVRFVEGEYPGSTYFAMEVKGEDGLDALRAVLGDQLKLTIISL